MDDYAIQFHERVRNGYLEMAAAEPERWVVIDADRDRDAIQKDVLAAVTAKLEARL